MKKLPIILAIVFSVMALALAYASSLTDSVTVDELNHIAAGYTYLTRSDMRFNPEHPPLAKDIAALPLLFTNIADERAFASKDGWLNNDTHYGVLDFSREFLYRSGNDADAIVRLARLPMYLFLILAAGLLFFWARRIGGDWMALLSLVLFIFSPTVLAHSRLVTTDIPAASGVLLATILFLRYLKKPSRRNQLWLFFGIGFAVLLKFSVLLILPYFILLQIIYSGFLIRTKFHTLVRSIGKTLITMAAVFIFIVGPFYALHMRNYPPELQKANTVKQLGYIQNWTSKAVVFLSDKPIIRYLDHYALGFLLVQNHVASGHTIYFLGRILPTGHRLYFPFVYFIKEPLTWWLLVFISIFYSLPYLSKVRPWRDMGRDHFEIVAASVWIILYFIVSMTGKINIGVRHLLPIYPFAALLVSYAIVMAIRNLPSLKKKIATFAVGGIVGAYILESFVAYPFYLPYFNQSVGGLSVRQAGRQNGWRYVVDSNIDWGQDLYRFRDWFKTAGIDKISFDYFSGWADPNYYVGPGHIVQIYSGSFKDAADFIANNQTNGWLAISVQYLQTSPEYAWLHTYQPTTIVGSSIFVYHLQKP